MRRPVMRVILGCALVVAVGLVALHVWALLLQSSIDAELSSVPLERTPPPEIRASDGFVPLVDAKLRAKLGGPSEITYDWWSAPKPVDIGIFRGWAVRFSYHTDSGRALCSCGGTRIAVLTDTWCDSIVTEADLREVAGDSADPFLGQPEPDGPSLR
jgi:hypothetical protein